MAVCSLPRPVDANWRVYGNCRRLPDPDIMSPPRYSRAATAAAKQVCAGCTVTAECLTAAIDRDERFGVWGGKTPAERDAPGVLARRSARSATRMCRWCGQRRPAALVVNRRCTSCEAARAGGSAGVREAVAA